MIALLDYGVGNLQSLERAFAAVGAEARPVRDVAALDGARAVVLPGVGHFQEAMDNLREGGLIEPLQRKVMGEGLPLMGMCLGMQLLMRRSDESGAEGLGWLNGEVRSLRTAYPDTALKIPHIGWNTVTASPGSKLFAGVPAVASYYFAHSYAVLELEDAAATATAIYGVPFIASVEKDNLFATQFHPEKSHQNGIHLLRNFMSHVVLR
ncbi:MAG: hypothetical protein RLZZ303_3033 [Candidatus Hydrogenedentota bacterium]